MGAEENKMATHAMAFSALGVDSSTVPYNVPQSGYRAREESLPKVANTLDNDPPVEQGTQRGND